MDIKQLGPGRIREVSRETLPFAKLPGQPAIKRANTQLTVSGTFSAMRDLRQHAVNFGRRKQGINLQSSPFRNHRRSR